MSLSCLLCRVITLHNVVKLKPYWISRLSTQAAALHWCPGLGQLGMALQAGSDWWGVDQSLHFSKRQDASVGVEPLLLAVLTGTALVMAQILQELLPQLSGGEKPRLKNHPMCGLTGGGQVKILLYHNTCIAKTLTFKNKNCYPFYTFEKCVIKGNIVHPIFNRVWLHTLWKQNLVQVEFPLWLDGSYPKVKDNLLSIQDLVYDHRVI